MRFLLTLLGWVITTAIYSQASVATDHFDEGMKAIEAKKYAIAVEHFKKAVARKPQEGKAWYQLGWCYNELAMYQEAIKALKNARIWWKEEPKVFYESGYANDFAGKIDDAIADYKKCLALDNRFAEAYRQLANIYFDIDKDYKTALGHYNQFVNYSPEKDIPAKTWYKKGYCEIELELFDEATISLKKSVALDNKYISAYDELGYAYYQLNRADDAITAYTASRRLDSLNSIACSGLGDVYRYLKRNTDEALTCYMTGARINPKSQNCNYGTGWCYNEKGMYAAAIPYLQKTIAINSKHTAAYTELGYAYYALKNYDTALFELDNSLKIKETAVAYYYKGLCYVGKKQKADAETMYRKLVTLKSPDAPTLLKKINAM